jgi:hypothetical protein
LPPLKICVKQEDMRKEYPREVFGKGVRGKHYRALQAGYAITVHKADGTKVVREVKPKEGAVIIEPNIRTYFPDSKAVKKALRCLIPLLPQKQRAKANKAQ